MNKDKKPVLTKKAVQVENRQNFLMSVTEALAEVKQDAEDLSEESFV